MCLNIDLHKYNNFVLSYDGKTRNITRKFADGIVSMTIQHIAGIDIDKDLSKASINRMNDGSIVIERIAYGDSSTLTIS